MTTCPHCGRQLTVVAGDVERHEKLAAIMSHDGWQDAVQETLHRALAQQAVDRAHRPATVQGTPR